MAGVGMGIAPGLTARILWGGCIPQSEPPSMGGGGVAAAALHNQQLYSEACD